MRIVALALALLAAFPLKASDLSLAPAPRPIQADARLDDWAPASLALALDRPEQAAIGRQVWKAEALSATVRLAYDAQALYLAAEVHSAWPARNKQVPSSAWNGDALQLFFSFDGGERAHSEHGDQDLHVVIPARPKPGVWSYGHQAPLAGARAAFKARPGGWVLEAVLPLSAFPGAKLRPGGAFRLDLALDGSGGSDRRSVELSLSGRDDSWQSTQAWLRGRLGEGPSVDVPEPREGRSLLRRIPYLKVPRPKDALSARYCVLDLHRPAQAPKGMPVLVYFHGGGLTGGKREVPAALRDQGILVIAPGYRFSPAVKAPAYIEDAAAAVAWALEHAAEYGGDPERIWLSGHSAGGYLASMVALDPSYLAALGHSPAELAGAAPLSGQAITHFTVRKERGIPELQPILDRLAPLYHVRKDAPPYHIFSGDREKELFGRYEENAYLWRMLKLHGHPDVSLTELKGEDHGSMAQAAMPALARLVRKSR